MTTLIVRTPLQKRPLNFIRGLHSAAMCLILAGCAAAPASPDTLSVMPEAGIAIVVGWGNTAGEYAHAALTPAHGARVSRLFVVKANDIKFSFGHNTARLPPGAYDLTVSCGLYIDQRLFTSEAVVQATLNAGRVYHLRAEPEGRKCQPYLEDAADKRG